MSLNIWGSREYNSRHNRELEKKLPCGKMINGQSLGAVAEMRYGLCPMSFNGCECIAVYNALIYIKKPQPLSDVVRILERYKMLSGIFGCNPYKLGKALGFYGAAFERTKDMKENGSCIVSFWTGIPFLSTIHTVFCAADKDGITVYNRYNRRPLEMHFSSVAELTKNRKPIAIYYLR